MGLSGEIKEIRNEVDGAIGGIKDEVDEFVDAELEPRADKMKSFMKRNGKKVVLGAIIVAAILCAVTVLNDVLPTSLF